MPTRVAETGVLTATSLTIIAIMAVITILGILWGMRLKRARREADRIEIDRVEAESGEQPAASALTLTETPARAPTLRPPVAPAPPPLAETPVAAAPAAERSLADESIAAEDGDRPLTDLKGLGPKAAARLAELGITIVGQIAALDAGEAERLDAQLGPFTGRLARDRWIEQARFLAAGDVNGFEAVFGQL